MEKVKNIIHLFRNKYILALTVFAVLMLFIDRNDIFNQFQRKKQLHDLLITKKYYKQQIEQTKKNLADLQNNAAALEKYAREKYLLKRDNEDVFVVDNEPGKQKNSNDKQ
jgi:cell division protein FtsB